MASAQNAERHTVYAPSQNKNELREYFSLDAPNVTFNPNAEE